MRYEIIQTQPYKDAVFAIRKSNEEDIGKAVVFLASESASYITGEVLRVDGGLILPGMPEKIQEGKTDWGGMA